MKRDKRKTIKNLSLKDKTNIYLAKVKETKTQESISKK